MLRTLRRSISLLLILAVLFFIVAECDVNLSGTVREDAAVSYTLTDEDTGRLSLFGKRYTVDHRILRHIREALIEVGDELENTSPSGIRAALRTAADALARLVSAIVGSAEP